MVISNNLPSYPGDPLISIEPALMINEKGSNVLAVHLGTHSGTHLDVPLHKLEGADSISDIPLDRFMGDALFVDIPKGSDEPITAFDLEEHDIREEDILIVRTGWEKHKYQEIYFKGFPYFSPESADYLIEKKIKCIGVDIPSVDCAESKGGFHKKVLSRGIIIVESLINLKPLTGKRMFFMALPLNIKDGDGSPVRAAAVERLR